MTYLAILLSIAAKENTMNKPGEVSMLCTYRVKKGKDREFLRHGEAG